MIENNRIIIVDDSEEDLTILRNVFYDHGIGCRGFVHDDFNYPKQPLKGVRFAFFDIHLNQSGDTNSTLEGCNPTLYCFRQWSIYFNFLVKQH